MPSKTTIRYTTFGAAIAGAAVAGALLASPLISGAQESTTSTTAPAASTAPADPGQGQGQGRHHGPAAGAMDPTKGGHVGDNGTKEELLTGDAAASATAAAQAAVPGGTIQRVENDAEGAVYEAHATTADGKQVTVKMDANFVVTSTEDGNR